MSAHEYAIDKASMFHVSVTQDQKTQKSGPQLSCQPQQQMTTDCACSNLKVCTFEADDTKGTTIHYQLHANTTQQVEKQPLGQLAFVYSTDGSTYKHIQWQSLETYVLGKNSQHELLPF